MTSRSISIYTPSLLAAYNVAVHGLSNHAIWRCPTSKLFALYATYAGPMHLDVGVGTGYLIDRSVWPVPLQHLVCLDASRSSLATTAHTLQRYQPTLCLADVRTSLPFAPQSFDSIGCTYVLHCLPIPFEQKLDLLVRLSALLRPGGTLFGATVLGHGVEHSPQAQVLLHFYNAVGAFSTDDDQYATLVQALTCRFRQRWVHVVGSVALFAVQA